MRSISNKNKFAIFGALIVPIFGRLALSGTGHEHEYYRYIVPLFVGGLAGYLIGSMRDRWQASHMDLIKTNDRLESEIVKHKQTVSALLESEERYRTLFENNHNVMLLIDPENADIVDANPAAISYYGWAKEEITDKKISDINILSKEQVFQEMERAKTEKRHHFIFKHRLANQETRNVEVFSGPIIIKGKKLLYSIIHDITERMHIEKERENLIKELQIALDEVKRLRGIIPICSQCKNIRDDKGAWDQMEKYISERSDVQFSHGICPDCAKKLYADLDLSP